MKVTSRFCSSRIDGVSDIAMTSGAKLRSRVMISTLAPVSAIFSAACSAA